MKRKTTQYDAPGYLRRADAAKYLGISVRSIAEIQRKRMVPFARLGARTVVFRVADLDKFVSDRMQSAAGFGGD